VGLTAKTGALIKDEKSMARSQSQPQTGAADSKQNKKIKFSDVVATQVHGSTVEKRELMSWLQKKT
jgi:hypothetical protein